MKRQIDPNLNNSGDGDLLFGLGEEKKESFGFNDYERRASTDPEFKVTEKEIASPLKSEKESGFDVEVVDTQKSAGSDGSSDSSHHHSSSGTHHSSSGSHHSSSGTHHSSSGSHHSSSSSHHHSSSGSHHSSGSSHHHHSSSGSHHHHSSSSSHHHSSKKKKMPLPAKIALIIIIILLLAIVAVAVTFFVLQARGKQEVTKVTQETDYQEIIEYNGHTYKYNEDVFAMCFIGVDKEDFVTADETDFVGAADTDIVITVDTKTGKANMIAIPRDTMVDIDITSESGIFLRTEQAQLCLAYAYGDGAAESCENTVSAMSRVLYNVPIEKYFVLDIDGIAPLNDAIGGVTLESLYDFEDKGIKKGDTITLKGDMAELYVRRRDTNYLDSSLGRVQRQTQYLKAYSQQVLPAILNDFSTISNLYNTASDYSQTNVTLSNVTYIASLLLSKGVTDYETYTLEGELKSSKDAVLADVSHAEFYPDEDYLMQTIVNVFYTQID